MWRRSWPVSHIVYSGEIYCSIFASADTIFFSSLPHSPSLFVHGAVVKMSYLAVGASVSRTAFGVILL